MTPENGAGGTERHGRPVPVRNGGARRGGPFSPITPEQTCLGCAIAAGMVLLCGLFWGWFFWQQHEQDELRRNAPPPRAGKSRLQEERR